MSLKVWVVDDDPSICNMLRLMLSAKGYHVETYTDPMACPIIQERDCSRPGVPPCADVLLVDYFMPNMNGLEFLRKVEEFGCKVAQGNRAVITAHYSPELGSELARMGVTYFKKPFKFPALDKWLESCSRRASCS